MSKTYPKMNMLEFGRHLLITDDLDPVYVLLHGAGFESEVKLKRWLLAYWCFYHVGTASWITDQKDYWKAMLTAAGSKEYPRSSERRHFRGQQALASVNWLQERDIGPLFAPLTPKKKTQANTYLDKVMEWRGFGPWISFKVADMMERLGLANLEFDVNNLTLYDSPAKGAELAVEKYASSKEKNALHTQQKKIGWAVKRILVKFETWPAPPRGERPVNIQEAETILCKWKSHTGGHYHVGGDIESLQKALSIFPGSKTNQRLKKAGEELLW